jgi:hypothetical protein
MNSIVVFISSIPFPSGGFGPIVSKSYPPGWYLSASVPGTLPPSPLRNSAVGFHLVQKVGFIYQGRKPMWWKLYNPDSGLGSSSTALTARKEGLGRFKCRIMSFRRTLNAVKNNLRIGAGASRLTRFLSATYSTLWAGNLLQTNPHRII